MAPPLTYISPPISDSNRPWGRSDCEKCSKKGHTLCHGHYLKPEDALQSTLQPMLPPSLVLKEVFKEQKGQCSAEQVVELAKTCLLPVNKVEMWWDHLKTVSDNRREGAAKAAKTR